MLISKLFLSTIFLFSFILASPTNIQNNIYTKINLNLDNYNIPEKNLDNNYLIFEQSLSNSTQDNKSKEITDEEVKKNREKNKSLLFFILSGFVAIVLISFIVVYSYLKCHTSAGSPQVIEEDQNYSDIGGLTPNKIEAEGNKEEKGDEINKGD